MRRLSLVRHAHAERGHDHLPDFERELDKHGRRDARRLAAFLASLPERPQHLVTSSAVRTVQTAKALAQALEFPFERIRHDDRAYLAEAEVLLAILRSAPAAAEHVLLVGHNPGLSVLAGRLDAESEAGEMPTAALYELRFTMPEWAALDWRAGQRLRYVVPDDLPDP